ncbi:tetratricopeptide repeat protein [Actinoplanes sp. L3-i22]|uniref:tetratricopeptide repeat protein n=1 Tax=Actinoplanes sp. L3-i22 TaxID=2836373 RepID=UPI001C7470CE|nr:tetratricopeptide repeat protein [Actinoplanes sp. L3-i22]BCY10068.1 molecular chaperone Tir [Actinoplanes sp. L3-i22]
MATGWRRTLPWLPRAAAVAGSGNVTQTGGGFANTGIFVGTVVIGPRSYEIVGLPAAAPGLPAGFSPSQLLSADHQVVKFGGRGTDLQHLADWRDAPGPGRSVLLVHAPGGQGKTRLVSEFAQRSALGAGFHVMIAQPASSAVDPRPGGPEDGSDVLLVIDYAERWIVEDLVTLLNDHRFVAAGRRIRVLLVARTAGLWWQGLRHQLTKAGFGVDAMALGPIAAATDHRAKLFTEAATAFAGLLPGADADTVIPPDLGAPEYGLVLTVHMAALAAVDATRYPNLEAPTAVADLSAYLLDREVAHWVGLRQAGAVRISPATMSRTVFTAVLAGALPYPSAVDALATAGVTDDPATAGQILDDHAVCYPSGGPVALEPLYPDRLAEDFLALQIPGHDLASYQPQPWAVPAARHLILADGSSPWPSQALQTVVEAGQRWPHVVTAVLNPVVAEAPESIARLLGSAVLAGIAALPAIDVAALDAVYEALPKGNHVSINLGLAALASRITDHRLASAANPYEVAGALNQLGYRLFNAGQYTRGLEVATRAVDAYREADRAGLPRSGPALGMALSNLAAVYHSLGRLDLALPVAREAVETLTEVVTRTASIEDRRLLGGALLNYGDVLAKLEQWDAALAAVDESQLLLHTVLDETDQLGDTVSLAKSLVSIGAILRNLERPEDAVEATEEAIRHCSLLAAYDAHAYEPMLASAFHNLSVQQQEVDDPELLWALQNAVEAVGRWRGILDSSDGPRQYAQKVLFALENLVRLAATTGRRDLAIAASEELLVRSTQLAGDDPQLRDLTRKAEARLHRLRREGPTP